MLTLNRTASFLSALNFFSAQSQQVSVRLPGQLSAYIPVATILKRERGSKFPLNEIIQTHSLQPLWKIGTSRIACFHSCVGIFSVKEPKVTQLSVLLHVSISKCYMSVMLCIDLDSPQVARKIYRDL